MIQLPQARPTWDELRHLKPEPIFGRGISIRHFLSAGIPLHRFLTRPLLRWLLAQMYLLHVLVKLPPHGSIAASGFLANPGRSESCACGPILPAH
jgi:hypothetical protein